MQPILPLVAALVLSLSSAYAADQLDTEAERSGFHKTGRYQEVIELCSRFQAAYPKAVKCIDFGTTPEGRPMKALVASTKGMLSPEAARHAHLPVVFVQGGIHAGEIDGKDAGFLALREMLEEKASGKPLDKAVLVFIPVFNIDGHERFGQWNRPNQRGPEQMGWRTTAQNINLNRDYLKADAPEMQAMLALVNRWDPLVYVDMHVTDGAKFEHDVSIQAEPVHVGDAELQRAGTAFRDAVIEDIRAQGSSPQPFYMSFQKNDDPASGFADSVFPPRYSNSYFQLRNRFGMLVETHSWKDYPTRVRISRNTIISVMNQVAAHGRVWLTTAQAADLRSAKLGGQPEVLSYKTSEASHLIDFRGYEYTRTQSDVSGATMVHYDEGKPQIWRVPLRDQILPDEQVTVPVGGYVVPAAYASLVAPKLQAHGVQFSVLDTALVGAKVEVFRALKVNFAKGSFEGHQRLSIEGSWKAETRDLPIGSLFVPTAQPRARIAIALFEPKAPDSLLQWGMFNGAFEQKEYMEDYVAEDVAREQLRADPALKAEFEQRVAADPAFAGNPSARLEFFARRHASWDERLNLYPVLRMDEALQNSQSKRQ
jgi:hypothetical protein